LQNHTEKVLAVLGDSGQKLHALLLRLTLRADVADDLLQELFLRLNRSAEFAGVANRTAYAFRAAVHLAFDWRRQRKQPAVGIHEFEQVEGDSVSPLQTLVAREQMEQLLETVGRLKRAQREAVVMHYIQQESFQSIAGQLNKTPHQVRALCHKGIRQLRNRLAAEQSLAHKQAPSPKNR
jgi:RNA polymerase sigma-70 factor (ECF subfamily)